MQLFNIITSLKKKWMDPKVYAIVVKTEEGNQYLHLGMHYTLEEALGAARKDAIKASDTPKQKEYASNAKPSMWTMTTVEQLIEPVSDTKMKEAMKVAGSETNELMQKIVKSKDRRLLEKNKDVLSAEQYQYLSDEIK
jgi:hypothetical protein